MPPMIDNPYSSKDSRNQAPEGKARGLCPDYGVPAPFLITAAYPE